MIDTIILLLSKKDFEITNPGNFSPSAQWVLASNLHVSHNLKSMQFPTKKDLKGGIYKPRLTLSNRNNVDGILDTVLKIELSLPKLMFNNNFEELRYKDFDAVADKLHKILLQMGVQVTIETLKQVSVTTVHYAKNILLTDGTTPHYLIGKIKQATMPQTLDANQTDYRNHGHSYKWHCNSYEIAFYDKMHDLEKSRTSDKRAIKSDSAIQLNLFETLKQKQHKNKFEVFRMEVRLNKRSKMKQLFKKLEIKAPLMFQKLFKPAISRKILLYYLDEIEQQQPALLNLSSSMSDEALLATLIVNNPHLSAAKILQQFGLKKVLETINLQKLKQMFTKNSKRNWQRLMADTRTIIVPNKVQPLDMIRKQIQKGKVVKL